MSITLYLILITSALSIWAFTDRGLMDKLIFSPYAISRGNEHWRFLTSGFLHANWMHLFFNMFVLYFFGRVVERYYQMAFGEQATLFYLLLYGLGIVCSSIFTYFRHKDDPTYRSLGASGAVSSVLFASIIFQPLQEMCLYFILCLPSIIFGVAYLVYSVYMGRKGQDNVNHDAHFFGAVFGIVFTIVLEPEVVMHFIDQFRQWLG